MTRTKPGPGLGSMRFAVGIALILLCAFAAPALARQEPAYILVDIDAGTVLENRDAGTLWHPASVTKLMTAYVTFQALRSGEVNPHSRVVVTQNALNEPPSKMGYKVGTDMTLDNALKMMIVRSANDIAVAIAETVGGGSEAAFVARMNATARQLGMASTVYVNPNGLPADRQVTTARDLAVLARAIWRDFPDQRDLFKIPAIKAGKKILRSQNTLLERFRGANGMKTGFICASGFNMVATATRSGKTLAAVVLGADSASDRAEMAAALLQGGFKPKLFGGNKPSLAGFKAGRAPGPAVDLHNQVCGKRQKQEGEEEPLLAGATGRSALEPRFRTMDPVPVVTGMADKTEKTATKKAVGSGNVPIPRPRPPMPGAASQVDPIFERFENAFGDAEGDQ
jgi:D-alanyl-D-alanine carboxypeptidase